MESRKSLILFAALSAILATHVSCTTHNQTPINWLSNQNAPIKTTMIEVSGDKGEKLTVLLDFKTGECRAIELKGEKIECNDIRYTSRLEENYFCIPAKFAEDNKKNSVINDADGEKDMYCGKVTFLTNGADIQIKSSLDPEAGNRKCKNVGGHVICYPPL